jgi:hydroxymethylbilane synthase
VPGELPEGLSIVGVPPREDPLDALCGARSLDAVDEGAVVGTASLRRRAQLLALRPDLEVRELRGNVDTRLRRLEERDFDAIVLARAGLVRLGRSGEGTALGELIPAPGQGCLVLEARSDDRAARAAAASLTDDGALTALTAERAVVTALGATCRTPIGAYARREDGALRLTAFVGLPDGSHWIRDELDGDPADPAALGREVAQRLDVAGAGELLAEAERIAG